MSSNRYEPPLQIELRPSRHYLRLIHYSHLAATGLCLYSGYVQPWYLLLFPAVILSYRQALRRYRDAWALDKISLYSDRRVVCFSQGIRKTYLLGSAPVFWFRLVILDMSLGGESRQLLLFADAMEEVSWSRLNLYLRFCLD